MKIVLKLVKYACCCAMIFVAIVLIAGSTNDAKKNPAFLIIPALMALAEYCTYRVAKRKALERAAFTWWLYGTFVPKGLLARKDARYFAGRSCRQGEQRRRIYYFSGDVQLPRFCEKAQTLQTHILSGALYGVIRPV